LDDDEMKDRENHMYIRVHPCTSNHPCTHENSDVVLCA
jgi:hypothetical protein